MAKYRRGFTKEEQDLIKREYLTTMKVDLIKKLGCSEFKLTSYMKRNNLVIPKEIIDKRRRSRTSFKKGMTPHNKGRPMKEWMSEEGIKSCSKTRFKKGLIPHNVHPDGIGAITERHHTATGQTYKYIKISDDEWMLYHRYLFEKHHKRKIKDGHIVIFKDKNSFNLDIDNLMEICRAENMFRNSYIDYPEEIIPSLLLVSKLNKTITEKQKEND